MQHFVDYAKFLYKIRTFFAEHNILEVNTKSLLNTPTLDNNIDNISITANKKYTQKTYYLHTSPEFEMKKILASSNSSIYQIAKVYRDNEIGKQNFNEFIMLEYYLIKSNIEDLITHTLKLLQCVGITKKVYYFSYNQLLKKYSGIDIFLSYDELSQFAYQHQLTTELSFADLQGLIWVHFVEQHLKNYPICVVYDFPKEQQLYAKIEKNVAKRCEIYINGVEVANGYEELQTYDEYHAIFTTQSQQSGKKIDYDFLHHIKNVPLPQCSGIALGLERIFAFYT